MPHTVFLALDRLDRRRNFIPYLSTLPLRCCPWRYSAISWDSGLSDHHCTARQHGWSCTPRLLLRLPALRDGGGKVSLPERSRQSSSPSTSGWEHRWRWSLSPSPFGDGAFTGKMLFPLWLIWRSPWLLCSHWYTREAWEEQWFLAISKRAESLLAQSSISSVSVVSWDKNDVYPFE